MRGTRCCFGPIRILLIVAYSVQVQMSHFRKISRFPQRPHDEVMMSDEQTSVANNEHIDVAPDDDLRRQLEELRQENVTLQRG